MEQLHQFETMDETAIRQQGSHPVELQLCCKDARDRLEAIQLDDLDEIMSSRLTGRGRGVGWIENVMFVLWWDLNHQVCPSLKRNT